MSRVLGIDHGRARLGLALSDESGILATPLRTLDARRLEPLLRELQGVVTGQQVVEIVLGLPLNADGSEGPQAALVRRFGRRLERLGVPVVFQDEHLTSCEAREKGARDLDAASAALILQAYLDKRRNPRA